MDYLRLRGIGVSPGIVLGEVVLAERIIFTTRKDYIPPHRVPKEIERLGAALLRTREEITAIKDQVRTMVGEEHAFIFDAHLLILEDPSLTAGLERLIREENVRTESALSEVHEHYRRLFASIADDYIKQRQADVTDVLTRIHRNLDAGVNKGVPEDLRGKILVAHELLPSEAAMRLSQGGVLAVALDMGGPTSHAAILARSLDIPTVVGLHDVTQRVNVGDQLIVDGTDGEVIINPPLMVRKEFQSKKVKYEAYRMELRRVATWASVTLDGVRFAPMANIELPEEIGHALSYGAEGVGLFRSEFIYLQRSTLPTEEEHFEIYDRLAREVFPRPVYIRTIDIGGEKSLPQLKIEAEPNPALGLRAIRFSLRNRELFRIQIRAILRASVRRNIRIIIPMITEMEEIGAIRVLFREAQEELTSQGHKFDPGVPVGIMIEVPAAAAISDLLAREVDFFSIGTNDLLQYYLAVDRSNEYVSYLYKPLHPAALRLLKYIIGSAARQGKDVALCGEMAADPLLAIVLLGLGLRTFSMNPIFIPRVKKALRAVEVRTVRRVVQQAMNLRSAQEVEEYIIEKLLLKYPDAFLMTGPSS
ncbi:MAG: phosphoenolpyruvate--protein phosphotransferase [Candidatus Aminicenantes bacterium]|nr:phosphoenolpyruvate--protein phosphotransferase [Candidatus Aminicenantes bacterium]